MTTTLTTLPQAEINLSLLNDAKINLDYTSLSGREVSYEGLSFVEYKEAKNGSRIMLMQDGEGNYKSFIIDGIRSITILCPNGNGVTYVR